MPTAECLVNWLKKAWFTDIEVFHVSKMSTEEQRPTEFMVRQSYKDYVQEDGELTIEGYPAPVRIYVSARKPGNWMSVAEERENKANKKKKKKRPTA